MLTTEAGSWIVTIAKDVLRSAQRITDTFTVVADEAGESRFDIAAGLDSVNEGGLSNGAEYRGRFASDYQSHSGGVRARFAF